MELETCTDTGLVSTQDPTPEQIAHAVASLRDQGDSYVILSSDEMTYVQASGPDEDGLYDLEHQLGDIEHHYRAVEPVTSDEVTIALQAFATADETWKQAFQWKRVDLGNSQPDGNGCAGTLALVAVVLAGALTLVW